MKKLFSCLAIVAALLWVAEPVQADRVVSSYTLVPVTAANATSISVTRQTDGQGSFVLVVTFTFDVKDSLGEVRYSASTSTQLNGAQQASLATFVTNVGVPLLNAQENL